MRRIQPTGAAKTDAIEASLEEFVATALEQKLCPAGELAEFANAWQAAYENDESGFGNETTFDDCD